MSSEIETNEVSEVFVVPECNIGNLEERIKKLNRRAKRLGVKPIELVVEFLEIRYEIVSSSGVYWVNKVELEKIKSDGNTSRKPTGDCMGYFNVTVNGESPHYDGWTFIATLEPVYKDDGSAENLIKTVPGRECPSKFAHRVGNCDHCNKKRRRKETFVVLHENGEYKSVGRSCVADFLGGVDPKRIASCATWLASVSEACRESEEYFGESNGPSGNSLEVLLAYSAAIIAKWGWRSKSSCEFGGTPTASLADWMINKTAREPKEITEMRIELGPPTEKHIATSVAAVEWAKSLTDDECESNYLRNLRLIAGCEWCSYKNTGLAVSMVSAYLRHIEKLKLAEIARKNPSVHVGKVGERIELTVTCERIISIDGNYGTVGIHKMTDENGSDLTWFANGSNWLEAGETYKVKATVKKHDDYKGRPVTVVNRVKVVEELAIA